MAEARRGEIWLIDLGDPIGSEQGWRRPGLVVSSDHWNSHAATVTVLPMTRTRHGLPTRVEVEPSEANGLNETSYTRCEDVRAISVARLVHRVGTVDLLVLHQVGRVLRTFLEL